MPAVAGRGRDRLAGLAAGARTLQETKMLRPGNVDHRSQVVVLRKQVEKLGRRPVIDPQRVHADGLHLREVGGDGLPLRERMAVAIGGERSVGDAAEAYRLVPARKEPAVHGKPRGRRGTRLRVAAGERRGAMRIEFEVHVDKRKLGKLADERQAVATIAQAGPNQPINRIGDHVDRAVAVDGLETTLDARSRTTLLRSRLLRWYRAAGCDRRRPGE